MIHRVVGSLGREIVPLLRDRRGAVAMLLAMAIVPMFGAVGLAVDSSIGYLLRSRMSKSLDAAALAAGRLALNDDAESVAREFFDANFESGGGSVSITDFSFELNEDREFITMTATGEVPTIFMRVFGRDMMEVTSRTVIQRQTKGMELALVLDNTGSMWGSKFDAMQEAAFDLIDILYGDEDEVENLWVSLVPYTATVNIGPWRTSWLESTDRAITSPGDYSTAGWKGCVEARPDPYDGDDTLPSAQSFTSYYYAPTSRIQDNNWPIILPELWRRNNGRGPNLGCGPEITPLTASRSTIDTAIGDMGAWHRGGTTGNLGLSWGWRTISPSWRGWWGGETPTTHPLDYDTDFMDKVVVVLTDGKNQFYDHDSSGGPGSDYTAYGRIEELGVASLGAGRNILDARMAATCEAMKDEGIRIYSITFGPSPDGQAQDLFRNCANTPAMYYHAPSNEDLAEAFQAIGGELANLRIVE